MFSKIIHKYFRIPFLLNYEKLRTVKNPRATIFLVHGIAANIDMWKKFLPDMIGDFNIIAVDLLGHGNSPKPEKWWGAYSLKNQARALNWRIKRLRKSKIPTFVIGHSMGALITAEADNQKPYLSQTNFLISPPIYTPENTKSWLQENLLKEGYQAIVDGNTTETIRFLNLFIGAGVVDIDKFQSSEDLAPVRRALKKSIIVQDTYRVVEKLTTPTQIYYGVFDPVVVGKNIRKLSKINPKVQEFRIIGSHGPNKGTITKIIKQINQFLEEKNK